MCSIPPTIRTRNTSPAPTKTSSFLLIHRSRVTLLLSAPAPPVLPHHLPRPRPVPTLHPDPFKLRLHRPAALFPILSYLLDAQSVAVLLLVVGTWMSTCPWSSLGWRTFVKRSTWLGRRGFCMRCRRRAPWLPCTALSLFRGVSGYTKV